MEHNRVVYSKAYDNEIEYLEYDGRQYIDTGITPNETIEAEIKIVPTSIKDGSTGLLAARNNPQTASVSSNINSLSLWVNGTKVALNDNNYDSSWVNDAMTYDTSAVLRISNRKLYVDDVLIKSSGKTNVFSFDVSYGLLRCKHINNAWDTRRGSSGRLYYTKIWKDETLVRDFIPVRVGMIGYLYDKVSKKLFANQGTGNFILGNDVSNPVPKIRCVIYSGVNRCVIPMPFDSRVEYLESDGNQYIDTGHILNGNDKVDIIYDRLGYGIIFGSRSSYNSRECSVANESGGNHKYYIKFGITGQQKILYESNTQPTGTVSVHIESGDIKVNGTTVSTALYGSSFFNGNCFLFLINQNGSAYSGDFPQRIRSFKIEGIIDLIPVRKNGIGYMYDRVSGKLFGNSGTGQFILGNDIND